MSHSPTGDVDRSCAACGYDLRGLPHGRACPECGGTTAPTVVTTTDDPLSLMPLRLIRRLRTACWFVSIAVLVVVAALVALWRGTPSRLEAASVLVALAVLWAAAVWTITPSLADPAAVAHGFAPRNRVRIAARVLPAGWVAAAAAALLRTTLPATAMTSGLQDTLAAVRLGGVALGVAGIVLLAFFLQGLARWARDHDAETAFNVAGWGIPLATAVLFIDTPLLLFGLITIGIWVLAVAAFPYALLSLARSMSWTIVHAHEHREREERRHRRARRHEEEVGRAVDTMDAAGTRRHRARRSE